MKNSISTAGEQPMDFGKRVRRFSLALALSGAMSAFLPAQASAESPRSLGTNAESLDGQETPCYLLNGKTPLESAKVFLAKRAGLTVQELEKGYIVEVVTPPAKGSREMVARMVKREETLEGQGVPCYLLNGKTPLESAKVFLAKRAGLTVQGLEKGYIVEVVTPPAKGSREMVAKMVKKPVEFADLPTKPELKCAEPVDPDRLIYLERTLIDSLMGERGRNGKTIVECGTPSGTRKEALETAHGKISTLLKKGESLNEMEDSKTGSLGNCVVTCVKANLGTSGKVFASEEMKVGKGKVEIGASKEGTAKGKPKSEELKKLFDGTSEGGLKFKPGIKAANLTEATNLAKKDFIKYAKVDESKVFGSNPTYTVIPNYDEKTHLLKGYKVKNGEKGMTKISKDLIADIPMVSKGELDQRIVKNTLNRTMDQLNRCLETERKRYPTLQGKLLAELTVGTNGKVKKVIFTENTLKNENVESCIKNILLRQSFYEIDEEAVITSPITFGSSDRK